MKASWVLEANQKSKAKIIINEGSSRSTKTYSILQLLTAIAGESPGVYSVVRKTLPALKSSAFRDFLDILKRLDIFNPQNLNKSELIYKIRNSEIEFFSVDQFEKIRGRKRKDLFINEANELSYNDFVQLALRTTGKIYLDLNPSHDQFHWIETKIKTRDDVEVIHSTYLDNPFLEKSVRDEIERLRDVDPNLWRIYGQGIMGILENLVYSHWKLCDELPEGERIMGLDFGFNNPTALVEISIRDDNTYWQEHIYESRLTNQDLIGKMDTLEISKTTPIYADSSEPQRIQELQQAGYNVISADKGKDSVKKGIDDIKARGFFIKKDSVNIQKEVRGYKYLEKEGNPTEEVIKVNDHALDAGRYALHSHLNKEFIGFV